MSRQKTHRKRGPDIAVDGNGRSLPYSPDEIRRIVRRALDEGELLAAIMRMPTGELAVQVMGDPSQDLLEALEATTRAYRRVLAGH